MINGNELRLGNWVHIIDGNGNLKPLLVDGEIFEECGESFEPIPLSPEILEACGFVNKEKDRWYNDKADVFLNNGELQWSDDGVTSIYSTDIKYLHQFQNLYFALVGSELMIDEHKLKQKTGTPQN